MSVFNWLNELGIHVDQENLIRQAFIHTSYANEHEMNADNERLEFMGDAVLQCWISDQLYHLDPPLDEGLMSKARARLVCEESLSECAIRLGLNQYLYLGSGEEKYGGRTKPSICADMFEAFCGALYLSNGYDASSKVFELALREKINAIRIEDLEDYKSRLQEFVQTDGRSSVTYRLIRSSGPSNNPIFEEEVLVDGIIMGQGSGHSKKAAQQMAAKDAFDKLVK